MKFCNTCEEQFADRFSFCPVDGTPLGAVPATTVGAAATEAESSYPIADTAYPVADTSYPVVDTATFQRAPAAPVEVAATPKPTPHQVAATAQTGMIGEYHLTILEDKGLAARLASELGGVAHNYELTWPEFKRDPFGFVKRSIQGYGQMIGKFFGKRDAMLAILIAFGAIAALVGLLAVIDRTQS